MKKINSIILILLIVSCSSTNNLTNKHYKLNNFIFNKSIDYSKNGIENLKSKQDSLGIKPSSKNLMINFLTQTPKSEIHIEIKNDSIWRHTEQNGKMIGDYFMIQKDNGILSYYDKLKVINYKKYDLFSKKDKYIITENRNDKKQIKGFECFKIKLVKVDRESDLGNTIYEMYVTDKIDLPIHSVINLTKLIKNTFPMEIRVSEEKLPEISELYELTEINIKKY